MLFHTYPFVFAFAPISLLAFHGLRAAGLRNIALACAIAASLIFYGSWRTDYVPVLVASILLNYGVGCSILRLRGTARSVLMAAGVIANLSFLGYFKYTNFVVGQVNTAFGFNFTDPAIVLPLAVSFYTFQQVAYLVDCYRGKIHDNSFLHYCFVVTFFPHLVAGPIVRMQEIIHQFRTIDRPVLQNLSVGLTLFVVGLAKKVLVADFFAEPANGIFTRAAHGAIPLNDAWLGALCYTLQLYFDFSGYSDMAIGLARMFGFRLAVNFLSPYQAVNIGDFWRRWHITLSRFLRDYLYIPLGGSRCAASRTYLNLIITMALGGLWHGANWTFVAWGLYHGVLLAAHRAFRGIVPGSKTPSSAGLLAARSLTFVCVVIGWVIFRAPDFTTAKTMLTSMFELRSLYLPLEGRKLYILVALALAFCAFAPNVYQALYRFRPALLLRDQIGLTRLSKHTYHFNFRFIEAAGLSMALALCVYEMRGTVSQFLYFMF